MSALVLCQIQHGLSWPQPWPMAFSYRSQGHEPFQAMITALAWPGFCWLALADSRPQAQASPSLSTIEALLDCLLRWLIRTRSIGRHTKFAFRGEFRSVHEAIRGAELSGDVEVVVEWPMVWKCLSGPETREFKLLTWIEQCIWFQIRTRAIQS